MTPDHLFGRYRELQAYVGWTDDDARRVAAVGPLLADALGPLVDDFYEEIDRHPDARKVITGGREQVERLKGTLLQWVGELLSGRYDEAYVARRWRVGWRHVEIGLDQVYTNVALSRLRTGLLRALDEAWTGPAEDFRATTRALNKLLDLDLAIIEDAYQAEYLARQQRVERLAAIGQVSAGVAHELRNPLNVVKTSVYYLLNARNPTPQKTAEHLDRIGKHVDLADGVITALSRFAKLPAPDLRPCPLEQCVREALEVNPPGQAVRVVLDFPAGLPPALVDPDQARIVFGNLIRNARDRRRHEPRSPGPHHGAAVLDQGARPGARFVHRPLHPRQERRRPARREHPGAREYVHRAAEGRDVTSPPPGRRRPEGGSHETSPKYPRGR
jgi:signal transduction histidine kinase